MAQSKDRKFVNGIFIRQFWNNGDSQLLSIGLKKDEFIKQIQAIPADDRGFINLTAGSNKNEVKKLSTWISTAKTNTSSSSYNSKPAATSSAASSTPDDDDLPF